MQGYEISRRQHRKKKSRWLGFSNDSLHTTINEWFIKEKIENL
jgi:hypothetical protein